MVALPPFFVLNYFDGNAFAAEISKQYPAVASVLDSDPIAFVALATLWVPVAKLLIDKARKVVQPVPTGWEDVPEILLTVLNSVVGYKASRFQRVTDDLACKFAERQSISGGEAFLSITQPLGQIERLTDAILKLFTLAIRKTGPVEPTLRVSVLLLQDGQVESVLMHAPPELPVRSPVDELGKDGSGAQSAWKTRQIHVVESTAEAIKNGCGFHETHPSYSGSDGSAICYPVELVGSNLGLVITVASDVSRTFQGQYANRYEGMLEAFACRFRLEMNLVKLRGMVDETNRTGSAPA